MNAGLIQVRLMSADDAETISSAFKLIGWDKPVKQFVGYVDEQEVGTRICWVATVQGDFAGYVTLKVTSDYVGLGGKDIPEIVDLNVLPHLRRRGIASRLLDRAEAAARERSKVVAIGVGLHPGYNAAQRLYVKRGYIPDGLGVTYKNKHVAEGDVVPFDDSLVLHLTKDLN